MEKVHHQRPAGRTSTVAFWLLAVAGLGSSLLARWQLGTIVDERLFEPLRIRPTQYNLPAIEDAAGTVAWLTAMCIGALVIVLAGRLVSTSPGEQLKVAGLALTPAAGGVAANVLGFLGALA